MKPTRIGKPYTVTHKGKPLTRVYVWFPDGTREMMTLARMEWTVKYGRPSKGMAVFYRDGKLVCEPHKEQQRINGKKKGNRSEGLRKGWAKRRDWRTKATRIYLDHKPYPLAA